MLEKYLTIDIDDIDEGSKEILLPSVKGVLLASDPRPLNIQFAPFKVPLLSARPLTCPPHSCTPVLCCAPKYLNLYVVPVLGVTRGISIGLMWP